MQKVISDLFMRNYCNYWLHMLDFCLLHYLSSSDSEAMTFKKRNKLVLYWIILKGNTSRLGSATQVLPFDIGEYLSSFFDPVVVVAFVFIFIL